MKMIAQRSNTLWKWDGGCYQRGVGALPNPEKFAAIGVPLNSGGTHETSFRIGIASSITTAGVAIMTQSIVIALSFGALAAGISWVSLRAKTHINESALIAAWPEVIDHLMSGIQSGLSLFGVFQQGLLFAVQK
jgi:Flp pilus assembly protein TadB